jgi:hypothetical protein
LPVQRFHYCMAAWPCMCAIEQYEPRSVAKRTFDSAMPPCYDRLDVCLTELFSAEHPPLQVPWPK